MTVLWLTPGYPWNEGISDFVFVRSQARWVARAGTSLRVVAPTPWVPPAPVPVPSRWTRFRGVPSHSRDGSIRIDWPRYLATPRENAFGLAHYAQAWALRQIERPHLIHAHFAYPTGATAQLLKRHWNVPLVLTLHGSDVHVYPRQNARMLSLFKSAVCAADEVISVSGPLADEAERISGVRPTVLSTGVDVSQRPIVTREEARRRYGLPADAFIVVFVGRLDRQKGVLDLAEAVASLGRDDVIAVFVGDGPDRPAGRYVKLLGLRPNEEVATILAAADVFALPSWHEGLGQSAVEAGACGVPIIAAKTGGLVELLGEDRGLLVAPRSVNSLADALRHVEANGDLALARAMRMRSYVERFHDVEKNARVLTSIYAKLTAIKAPGGGT
jgi:teichuronic acid biosynthesis glycosyltransferase TuaC